MNFRHWKIKTQIQLMIPVVSVAIRVFGIQNTSGFLLKRVTSQSILDVEDNLPNAKKYVACLIQGVKETPWKGNCLSRSMILYRILKLNGISSELCIGVRMKPIFKAHAWVEHKGIPLNAGKQVRRRYRVIDDYQIDKGFKFE